MNVRSLPSRALCLVFALLLLLLQSAAPLLHAHAADDPRDVSPSGFHLPGLESVSAAAGDTSDTSDPRESSAAGARDVISDQFYPLIEEIDCCLQRLTHEAVTASSATALQPDDAGTDVRTPLRPTGWHAAADCTPPPPRAPPRLLLA